MTPYDYILLTLALCGIARVWYERRQARLDWAAEVARREYGRVGAKDGAL